MPGPHEKPPRPEISADGEETLLKEGEVVCISKDSLRKIIIDTVTEAFKEEAKRITRVENDLHELKVKENNEWEEWYEQKITIDGAELFNNRKPHEALNLLKHRAEAASHLESKRGRYWAGICKSLRAVEAVDELT